MLSTQQQLSSYIFAKGEMADRTRKFDWSATSVGSVTDWPVSLLSTVNLILDSSFPMFIWWGEEKIQFYNDAYLKILGNAENSKHPQALGQRGEECWAETWLAISPLIERVLKTGESVYLEDQLIPIYRNNRLDDVYWTFSYNPIRGLDGTPQGILAVCTETTRTNQLLQKNEEQLKRVLDNMAEGVGIVDIKGGIVYSNPMAHQILRTEGGRFSERNSNSPEWFNIHLDGSPMADSDHPTMIAMTTGKPVFNYEFAVETPGADRIYLTMNAAPITDTEGNITGAVGMFSDITERKQIEEALQHARDHAEQQKRFYEIITSATPDLIYVFDLDYKFTYANKALLDMWGKSWDEAIGKGLPENGYEDWHTAMHQREIDQVVATKKSIRGEVSFPHATLGRRIYDYIFNPVIDESGQVVAVAGTTRDITDIRNAEAAIAESEARFRTMAEGTNIYIGMADETSNAIYFNQSWIRLTGRSMEELLAYGWLDLVHPDDKDRYLKIYLDAFDAKEPFHGDFRILNKDGAYRWLLADGSVRRYEDGSFAGFISASVDITELKEDEQRKNDFISMVSHELKTPLTSSIAYVQASQQKALKSEDAVTAGMLERTSKQLFKMTRMINGFLNVSRLESGKIFIDRERFDIALLLKEIEEEIDTSISSHQVVFKPVPEGIVNADREKIGQVIHNLISNAAKYSPVNSTIAVSCIKINGDVRIMISDEGIGIDDEDLPMIFERYYRVKDSETKNISGFGIGLYLCREIVKRHGGNIWAKSSLGKGSSFCFTLPLAQMIEDSLS